MCAHTHTHTRLWRAQSPAIINLISCFGVRHAERAWFKRVLVRATLLSFTQQPNLLSEGKECESSNRLSDHSTQTSASVLEQNCVITPLRAAYYLYSIWYKNIKTISSSTSNLLFHCTLCVEKIFNSHWLQFLLQYCRCRYKSQDYIDELVLKVSKLFLEWHHIRVLDGRCSTETCCWSGEVLWTFYRRSLRCSVHFDKNVKFSSSLSHWLKIVLRFSDILVVFVLLLPPLTLLDEVVFTSICLISPTELKK